MYSPEFHGLVQVALLKSFVAPCGLQADRSGDWQNKAVASNRPRPPGAMASAVAMVQRSPEADQSGNQPGRSRRFLSHPAVFGAML
jgi:hypothetical protein